MSKNCVSVACGEKILKFGGDDVFNSDQWISGHGKPRLVSVLIATYNGENLIVEAIESIKRQTYRPIELIVIDDGSTDLTGDIVRNWAKENKSNDFDVIYKYKKNGGLLSTRNAGLLASSGEFIQFLDQDDILHPLKLTLCVSAMIDNGSDVAISSFKHFRSIVELDEVIKSDPQDSYWMMRQSKDTSRAYLVRAFWGYLSPVFRRDLIAHAGKFPENCEVATAEEVEFHLRVKLCRPTITYLDKELAFHRITPGSITHQTRRVTRECSTANFLMSKILLNHKVYDLKEWKFLAKSSLRLGWRAVRYTRDAKAFFTSMVVIGIALGAWVRGILINRVICW